MTLASFIKEYRQKHDLSQRQLASMCGVSHAYISLIENERNYTTGKKMKISLLKMMCIAKGMRMSLHEIFSAVDDLDLSINETQKYKTTPTPLNEAEEALLELFRKIPEEAQGLVLGMIRAAIESQG